MAGTAEEGGESEKEKVGAVRIVYRVVGVMPARRAIGACSCLCGRNTIEWAQLQRE